MPCCNSLAYSPEWIISIKWVVSTQTHHWAEMLLWLQTWGQAVSRQHAAQVWMSFHHSTQCHAHRRWIYQSAKIFSDQSGPVVCNIDSGACAIYSWCVMMSYALGSQPLRIKACMQPILNGSWFLQELGFLRVFLGQVQILNPHRRGILVGTVAIFSGDLCYLNCNHCCTIRIELHLSKTFICTALDMSQWHWH